MKKQLVFVSLLLCLIPLWSCSSDEEPQKDILVEEKKPTNGEGEENPQKEETRTISLTDTQKDAVTSNNDFAFNLFRTLSQTDEVKGHSFVVSPLSLTYVLSMLNAGATGQTSREILELLGFSKDGTEAVNELCKQLIDKAPMVDKSVMLRLANMIAADKSVQLEDQYLLDTKKYYDSEVASLDFASADAVKYINEWCNRKTDGVIPGITDRLEGIMALLNAVYFKASWHSAFDKAETRNGTFTLLDGSEKTVPLMHRKDALFYTYNDIFKTIALTYGTGRNWAMYVLLPHEGKTPDDVLESLSSKSWADNLQHASIMMEAQIAEGVDVLLPRFKTDCAVNLNSIISEMGAPSMFLPKDELTGFSSNYKDMFVSLIKQKASIEVSEDGTEAAGVTIASQATATGAESGPPPVPEFHATRPFVYIIQEVSSGAIFFIGTYYGE